MKIIDAYWEKQNLGVACSEIICDPADTVDEVRQKIGIMSDEYLVAKVPVSRVDLLSVFQSAGFLFIEAMFSIGKNLDSIVLPDRYQRIIQSLSVREASAADTDKILAAVKGGVFGNDRISLDPSFSPALAANRYYNWIKSELGNTSIAYIVSHKNSDLGFSILKNNGQGRFNALFSSLFPDKVYPGFGLFAGWVNILKAKELGGGSIVGAVSSNNLTAVRMNLSIGYEITAIQYVLVKHLPKA